MIEGETKGMQEHKSLVIFYRNVPEDGEIRITLTDERPYWNR